MAIRNLVLYPDDPLTKVAEPYARIGKSVAKLAEDMFETMYAYDGVGLAGPQVGVSRRILVFDDREGAKMCLINPEIVETEGCQAGEEGCLSFPELYAPVNRAARVRVRAQDAEGAPLDFEASDFLARIIQHEIDHLDGVCFVDRLDVLTRQALLDEWDEVRARLTGASAPSR